VALELRGVVAFGGSRENVTLVARNASAGARSRDAAIVRKAMPCSESFSETWVAYAAGTT
jgi:hypothetical protein